MSGLPIWDMKQVTGLFQKAWEFLKMAREAKHQADINSAVIGLQSIILDLQGEMNDLQREHARAHLITSYKG